MGSLLTKDGGSIDRHTVYSPRTQHNAILGRSGYLVTHTKPAGTMALSNLQELDWVVTTKRVLAVVDRSRSIYSAVRMVDYMISGRDLTCIVITEGGMLQYISTATYNVEAEDIRTTLGQERLWHTPTYHYAAAGPEDLRAPQQAKYTYGQSAKPQQPPPRMQRMITCGETIVFLDELGRMWITLATGIMDTRRITEGSPLMDPYRTLSIVEVTLPPEMAGEGVVRNITHVLPHVSGGVTEHCLIVTMSERGAEYLVRLVYPVRAVRGTPLPRPDVATLTFMPIPAEASALAHSIDPEEAIFMSIPDGLWYNVPYLVFAKDADGRAEEYAPQRPYHCQGIYRSPPTTIILDSDHMDDEAVVAALRSPLAYIPILPQWTLGSIGDNVGNERVTKLIMERFPHSIPVTYPGDDSTDPIRRPHDYRRKAKSGSQSAIFIAEADMRYYSRILPTYMAAFLDDSGNVVVYDNWTSGVMLPLKPPIVNDVKGPVEFVQIGVGKDNAAKWYVYGVGV